MNQPPEVILGVVAICALALWRRTPRRRPLEFVLVSVVPICIAVLGLLQDERTALIFLFVAGAYLVVALTIDQVVGTRRYRAWHRRDFASRLSDAVNEVQMLHELSNEDPDDLAKRRAVGTGVDRLRQIDAPDAVCENLRDAYVAALTDRTRVSEQETPHEEIDESDRLLTRLGQRLLALVGESESSQPASDDSGVTRAQSLTRADDRFWDEGAAG